MTSPTESTYDKLPTPDPKTLPGATDKGESVTGNESAPFGEPPTSRSELLSRYVASSVAKRQGQYLGKTSSPTAVAELARLRRAVTTTPGADPEAWFAVLGHLPVELIGTGDAPSPYERAAHAAITLHAVHQQSKRDSGMHQPKIGLGTAVRALIRTSGSTDSAETLEQSPVMRRFRALGTATDFAEVQHHLRGLIGQLRSAGIGLDYGMLARDLYRLQIPAQADEVRLHWGRDLYRARSSDNGEDTDGMTSSPSTKKQSTGESA